MKPTQNVAFARIALVGTLSRANWGDGIGFIQEGGYFKAFLGFGYSDVVWITGAPIKLNQWTHLALVSVHGEWKFYVDGLVAGSASPGGGIALMFQPVSVGEGFSGLIDQFRIFDPQGGFDTSLLQTRAAPFVSSVAPANGVVSVGTPVVLSGDWFGGATHIHIGDTILRPPSFTVVDSRHIWLAAPPSALGRVPVIVATPVGASKPVYLEYGLGLGGAGPNFPAVQSRLLDTGLISASGGTAPYTYTITSGRLPDGMQLYTYGASCYVYGTTLEPAATYYFKLTATDSQGRSVTRDYSIDVVPLPPEITGVSPSSGPHMGGTQVTLTGANFARVLSVSFGEVTVPADGLTVNSLTQITVNSPPHVGGLVDVRVTTMGGVSATNAAARFAYGLTLTGPPTNLLATIGTEFRSDRIGVAGGTPGFSYAITAGSLPPGIQLCQNLDECYFFGTTYGPGSNYFVTITATDTNGATGNKSYKVAVHASELSITGMSVTNGPWNGGTPMTLTGTGFIDATNVAYGSVNVPASSFTVVDDSHITLTTPPQDWARTVDVIVSSPGGTSATNANARFSYNMVLSSLPSVWQVYPGIYVHDENMLSIDGGTWPYSFSISSGYLPGVLGLSFWESWGWHYGLDGTPSSAVGTYPFTVTATDSQGATGSQACKIVVGNPVLAITGLSATNGPWTGGTPVLITGADFLDATNVAFGSVNVPATEFTVVDDWHITLAAPPQAQAGAVDVIVATPRGTSATNAGLRFTYNLVIDTDSLPAAVQGVGYNLPLIGASGGREPCTYAITAGSLPEGIYLAPYFSMCYLYGTTYATAGSYPFTLTVTDSRGAPAAETMP